nr:hypothetical protein [Bacteroides sp.]
MNYPFEKWYEALSVLPAADRAAVIGAVMDYIHMPEAPAPKLQPALAALVTLLKMEVDAINLRREKARRRRQEMKAAGAPKPEPAPQEATRPDTDKPMATIDSGPYTIMLHDIDSPHSQRQSLQAERSRAARHERVPLL